jgi:hypothetical protein
LASYKFKIYYRKENNNGKTDALSRRSDYLIKEGKKPAVILKINKKEIISCNANYITEIVKYTAESEIEIIRNYHDDITAGHKKVIQIFEKLKKTGIQLPQIAEKVRKYIAACDTCSRTKYNKYKLYGLIKSSEVPDLL